MSALKPLLDSFNARNLTPAQVARTFVPPGEFRALLKPTSAIIAGPRGSGKTTLLKMLHQEALENWTHPLAEGLAKEVEFSTVFIATDRRWSTQLANIGGGRLPASVAQRLAVAAYTTQVLRALVDAMIARAHGANDVCRFVGRASLSSSTEADLVRTLAGSWLVSPRIPSLVALRQALTDRLGRVRAVASKIAESDSSNVVPLLQDFDWLYLSFLEAALFGVEAFNDAAAQQGRRWALAFDELELAPKVVLDELSSAVRASDEVLLFKLALSPAREFGDDLRSALSASPGHDYEDIRLWYPDRVDGVAFCRDMWNAMLTRGGVESLDPQAVLGVSYFEPEAGPNGHDYEPGSKWSNMFARMARNDYTFREFLKKRRIDVDSLHTMRESERAKTVRKIAPLLPLREFYRQVDSDAPTQGRRRSRKSPTLYTGASCLFAITEANPRWFNNLFERLLAGFEGGAISPARQAQAVERTTQRFAALLQTAPAPTYFVRGAERGVLGIVREIAGAIHDEHVIRAFDPEPSATFQVHSDADPTLIEILEESINWGAIVHVPEGDSRGMLGSIVGKRFRVSYLLAPLYGLPVRLGRPLSLRTLFSRRATRGRDGLPLQLEMGDGDRDPN